MTKQRMSNFKFRAILIPIIAFLFVLCLVATIAASFFSVVLDDHLGRGKPHIEGGNGASADYYEQPYKNRNESKEASYKVAQKVQNEGTVLLKNNGVLPLAEKTSVTPFGYRYLSPVYGQSGSGSAKWVTDPITPKAGLESCMTVNSAAADKMKGTPKPLTEASGTTSAGAQNSLMGGDSKIYEHPVSVYSGIESAVENTTAIVFIAREGQEGSDKKYDGYTDGTPHYLALTKNELDTVRFAKQTCKSVVLVIESSAPMELQPVMSGETEADAIIVVGHVGERGFASLGEILCGKVNPSGRTVDVWASDFTADPTYANFGDFQYTNAQLSAAAFGEKAGNRKFIEYAEDVYMGYRYYETADAEDDAFVYGELDANGGVKTKGAVAYPFGYGLSYTKFDKKITAFEEKENGEITVSVNVVNKGDRAGKETVQLYYTAPYTQFDKSNDIEKATTNLIAFAKTDVIEKGGNATVTLSFDKEEMASYCHSRDNGDGTKGAYVLEDGEYKIELKNNSHDVVETKTVNVDETVWYDSANPRKSEKTAQSKLTLDGKSTEKPKSGDKYIAANNRFDESTDYMNTESRILSRKDWKGTFPVMPADRKKTLSDKTAAIFGIEETFDYKTDKKLGNVEGSAVYRKEGFAHKENNLKLSDMRGLYYDDPKWEEFLQQIDFSDSAQVKQIVELMTGANYTTSEITGLGIPTTLHADGANGIKVVKTDAGMKLSATYGYAPLMAATWNTKLMYEVGDIFGKEAMVNNISGWYSPAINLHRSPFSGRVFEYYSEDPVLTGKIAAAVVSGAGDSGMYCYIKHFALNDQETNRAVLVHTWATEQAMRELYLKAFEIPFKESMMTIKYISGEDGTMSERTMRAATAVMASQNDIGSTIAHANYALLTQVLRGEWGFEGNVHSDMYHWTGEKNFFDLTFRAGCDTFLTIPSMAGLQDKSSPTAQGVMRRAVHNVAYAIVNSAKMQGVAPGGTIYYDMSPWKIWLIVVSVVVYAAVAAGVVLIVLRALDEKKHPENYMRKDKA